MLQSLTASSREAVGHIIKHTAFFHIQAFHSITCDCISSTQQHMYCLPAPTPHTVWVAESTALLPGCHGV